MWRLRFSLRTVLVLTAACCLLLAWWAPTNDEVRFAEIYFEQWRPSTAALRITTAEGYLHRVGYESGDLAKSFDWPDLSKSDVIPVPLNGLAGEPTAERRLAALAKPVTVDFHHTPLSEVADVLRVQCNVEIQRDLYTFSKEGVDPEMPITFHADGVPLRDVLHRMLEPRNLTFVLGDDVVCITTDRYAQSTYGGPSFLDSKDWFDYSHPRLAYRLRMGGRLVLITSFEDKIPIDSRAVGYTVPKGAKVLFVTRGMANTIDVGYTAMVITLGVGLVVYLRGRNARRRVRPGSSR